MKKFILKPKCHKQSKEPPKGVAYVSTGHLLPCCWCDSLNPKYIEEFKKLGFFFEDLKVKNNDTIEDIFMSDVWINFHKTIIEKPEEAPAVCKKNCSHE